MSTPEGRVKDAVKRVLKQHEGGMWYYMPVPSGYGRSVLDFMGAYFGHAFAIETKAPGKKPTDRQQACIDEMRNAGIMVFVIDGQNDGLEELKVWLAKILLQVP